MTTERCLEEIKELHRFLEAWLTGGLPASDEAFGRFEGVLAPEFRLVTPGGRVLDRQEVLDWVYAGHSGQGPSFRIHVRQPVARLEEGGLALATYEEWQEAGGKITGRLSTVLFRDRPDAPNGLEWVHLHETAMPHEEQPRFRRS